MTHLFHRTAPDNYYAWALCGEKVKTLHLVDARPDCESCAVLERQRERADDEAIVLAGKLLA